MSRFLIKELIAESRSVGRRVTQKDLAHAAGVTGPAINAIANGKVENPSFHIMEAVADVFSQALGRRITINDLVEDDDKRLSYAVAPAEPLLLKEATKLPSEDFILLPELGGIPGGDLSHATETHILARHWLPKAWVGKGHFLLRARGDCMAPRIEAGDLLLIEPGESWNNRDIVVMFTNDDLRCRYLHLYNDSAILVAADSTHQAIVITDKVTIVGRVIRSMKEFVKGWKP
jgi:SOS-response transcriptional repressor LexA